VIESACWHVRDNGSDFASTMISKFGGALSYVGQVGARFDLLLLLWRRITIDAGKGPRSFGSLAPPTCHAAHPVPDNFLAKAFTAHGGTNASTLPPSRAISFTILELR